MVLPMITSSSSLMTSMVRGFFFLYLKRFYNSFVIYDCFYFLVLISKRYVNNQFFLMKNVKNCVSIILSGNQETNY